MVNLYLKEALFIHCESLLEMIITGKREGHDPRVNIFSPGTSPCVSGELTGRGCLSGRGEGGENQEGRRCKLEGQNNREEKLIICVPPTPIPRLLL